MKDTERILDSFTDRWGELEKKSWQIQAMLSELEEIIEQTEGDDDLMCSIQTSKIYLILETQLAQIKSEQFFIEDAGVICSRTRKEDLK
ncbi:hypothetical protein FZD47_23985 [Bacillus infantis]|uniref:Uncharacterized protein n=1 Tax=Bacillus infantis TaxID=324767 RepID=A0A5D4S4K5_9BACI|nr:hypothetical protein [Bacillus infantis]TYS57899.1 hypothetical protein FZD47_23985 [Bacillus infantis]